VASKRAAAALAALTVLTGVAILAAGCSAASAPAAHTSGAAVPAAHASSSASAPPARPVGVVTDSLPGCTTAVQPAPQLTADTRSVAVPLNPFGVVATRAGQLAFVSLTGTNSVGLFRATSDPSLVRQIDLAGAVFFGEALTPDGRYLLAADGGAGAWVIDVSAAEKGSSHAVLGDMTAGNGTGAVTVAVSPDGRYAFVSLEDAAQISVFNLRQALTGGFGTAGYVGSIPVGPTPTDVAFSPDGQWAYATTEGPALDVPGTLDVISVRTAETDPAGAVIDSVPAGCNPVRVITSGSGDVVWVTARASDAVLAFSAGRLRTDAAHALVADVRVGEAPVPLALVRGGARLVVGDSDRFDVRGASASLAVIDVPAALAGRPALLGYLPAGQFPREMATEPGGRTLLVTNFSSNQLESVDVAGLP
jgi:DNA-binding beta-propeller fold protein YncE